MSNQAPKVDPSSWLLFLAAAVAILLSVFILVSSLINTIKRNSTKGEVESTQLVASAADNLKPIGASSTSDAPVAAAAAPIAARSGKEVYTAVCSACHATGVAGSPLFGDKDAWEPRVATGMDALMATAINGKGAMPARAGQNINDAELKTAILYMTKEAGFDLGGDAAPAAAAEPVKAEEKPAAAAEPEKKEEVAKEEPAAPEAPKEPSAPEAPAVAETAAAAAPAAAPSGDGAALYVSKGCGACHGADAKTPIMPLYPKIAGQGVDYVKQQMLDIKSGKRSNGQAVAMKGIMASVSEEETAAIAEYISSLK